MVYNTSVGVPAPGRRARRTESEGFTVFKQDFDIVCAAAEKKLGFMRRSLLGYFAASVLAGLYVAFGGFVSVTVSGLLAGAGGVAKLASAFSFAAALSLVLMAGSELFTGNNMVMAAGVLGKKVSAVDAMKLWLFCWIGNYAGAWLGVFLYDLTGLVTGPTADAFAALATAKLSLTGGQMFVRGILCNILVCLAVWCGFKMKSESGKLIMVFWCIFTFMICGFEHSVANMSSLGVAVLHKSAMFWEYVRDIGLVTLGNITGGVLFVALPYWLCARKSE